MNKFDCRLLVTSDIHGCITPYNYSDNKEQALGMAKLSPVINEYRTSNTLLLDNGDALQGSPLLYHHYLYLKDQLNPMAIVFNYLKYDYLNTGNHDFNFGYDVLKDFYHDSSANWLTGNICEFKQPLNVPYRVHVFDNGIRMALIGCVTQHIPNWELPKHIENLTFINCLKFIKNTVDLIKNQEKVDYIVCLYHGGIERDLISKQPNELLSGENQGYEICQKVEGINVLITGHQHQSIISRINGVLVTQTANDAKEIAVIDLTKNDIKAQLVSVGKKIDLDLLNLVNKEEKQTQEWLDIPLGKLKDGNLLINDMFMARLHKHPLVSFLNQVQMENSGVDISLVGLANKVVGFRNAISMRDIISSYVYPNTLIVLEMSGTILKQALEHSARYFTIINNKLSVSQEFLKPKPKHYNYDMFDGIEYTIKVSNPIGQRIINLTYHGEAINDNRLYLVAMNNYRAVGGGNYNMYKSCRVIKDTQKHIVDCIADYVIKHQVIDVDYQDNIKVII